MSLASNPRSRTEAGCYSRLLPRNATANDDPQHLAPSREQQLQIVPKRRATAGAHSLPIARSAIEVRKSRVGGQRNASASRTGASSGRTMSFAVAVPVKLNVPFPVAE